MFVRERDRDDPVRLTVNLTGSIIADRGITGGKGEKREGVRREEGRGKERGGKGERREEGTRT